MQKNKNINVIVKETLGEKKYFLRNIGWIGVYKAKDKYSGRRDLYWDKRRNDKAAIENWFNCEQRNIKGNEKIKQI